MNLSTINLPKKSGVEILFNKTYTRVSGFTMNNQDIIQRSLSIILKKNRYYSQNYQQLFLRTKQG